MPVIYQAQTPDDFVQVRALLLEYLTWATAQSKTMFNEDIDVNTMLDNSMSAIDQYMPPAGQLLLATLEGHVAGVVFLKRLRDDSCEIKRMYVQPNYRGKRMAHRLLEQLIIGARKAGYAHILLDSGRFMHGAHALYKSFGFQTIGPYPESELGAGFETHMVYMQLTL
jgi:GNAT superfamily N-acetyltransferase